MTLQPRACLRVLAVVSAVLALAACQPDDTSATGTSSISVAQQISSTADDQASYSAALASAAASIAAQVAPLSVAQRQQLAIQWQLAPITGDPNQTARALWASEFFAAQKSAQAAQQSYAAAENQSLDIQEKCLDLARRLIYPSNQAAAQQNNLIERTCEQVFGVQ